MAKYVRVGPRKLRLVADMVRGQNAKRAEKTLQLTLKRSAKVLRKVLHTAISNAENRGDQDVDNLYIKRICINEGPTFKRWLPRARGSASLIRKRTSHIELILEER